MSETHQVHNHNSTGSIQSLEKIEDTFKRVKVNEENTMEQSSPYPDRPGERDCQFFLKTGLCGYGNSCKYNHPLNHVPQDVIYHKEKLPERIGQQDCEYYLKTGACKYGSTCKYHHPKDRNGAGPVLFNVLGYPMRLGQKSCPFYMQTGMCRFGVACKFHHPHPQPRNGHGHGHSTYGMSTFPSVGFPYPGGLSTYGNYGAMVRPHVPHHPQAYMPFMVAPSQSWAPYMASSNPIYNVETQPNSSSSGSVPVAMMTSHHYSVPETAECRFFINTGACKFGDDCKYSHPKEQNLLNHPIVLPPRPGQPPCGNYKAYGFCKFGENCRFDHSMSMQLNPYNNVAFTIPTVSTHMKISLPLSRTGSEIEKQEDTPSQLESLPPSCADSTILSDLKKPSSESKKQYDNPAQLDNSEVQIMLHES